MQNIGDNPQIQSRSVSENAPVKLADGKLTYDQIQNLFISVLNPDSARISLGLMDIYFQNHRFTGKVEWIMNLFNFFRNDMLPQYRLQAISILSLIMDGELDEKPFITRFLYQNNLLQIARPFLPESLPIFKSIIGAIPHAAYEETQTGFVPFCLSNLSQVPNFLQYLRCLSIFAKDSELSDSVTPQLIQFFNTALSNQNYLPFLPQTLDIFGDISIRNDEIGAAILQSEHLPTIIQNNDLHFPVISMLGQIFSNIYILDDDYQSILTPLFQFIDSVCQPENPDLENVLFCISKMVRNPLTIDEAQRFSFLQKLFSLYNGNFPICIRIRSSRAILSFVINANIEQMRALEQFSIFDVLKEIGEYYSTELSTPIIDALFNINKLACENSIPEYAGFIRSDSDILSLIQELGEIFPCVLNKNRKIYLYVAHIFHIFFFLQVFIF